MRKLAGEIIGLAGSQHARSAAHRELDAPADHDARLLAAVREHFLAGGRAGRVSLVQHRQLPPGALRRHQAQRDLRIAQLDEIVGAEKSLRRSAQVHGEELGERHRHTIQHLLQRAHRGAHAVLLDEGNEPVGHPGAAGKLALRQPESGPDTAQARTDVDAHGV